MVEAEILTTMGLRSLGPKERDYEPRYEGWRSAARWMPPGLAVAYRTVCRGLAPHKGNTDEAKAEARKRFLRPVPRSSA